VEMEASLSYLLWDAEGNQDTLQSLRHSASFLLSHLLKFSKRRFNVLSVLWIILVPERL